MSTSILTGDCVEVMAAMAPNSVDAVVCDPPYELGFMGKSWDASGVTYQVKTWRAAHRVLKPGGHLLAFGGSRTYHRMACAVEDAGFEIRDQIMWLYGSGFPKSLDVSKAIDKAAGAKRDPVTREVVVEADLLRDEQRGEVMATKTHVQGGGNALQLRVGPRREVEVAETCCATDAARQWQGWGTALKPAHEPIVVARKPLIGTVAANVLKHGTGALNVDGCRVGNEAITQTRTAQRTWREHEGRADIPPSADNRQTTTRGRWPANVILDEEAGAMLDEQSDGASRFFYCPKASRKEREAGLSADERQNKHPTVKPVALMRYLVRLVTPPGGTVLDPFLGSGTTLMAAALEGVDAIGIEREAEYVEIAKARVKWAESQPVQMSI